MVTGIPDQIPPPRPPAQLKSTTSICEPHRTFIDEQPFLETFCMLLQDEQDLRRSRLTERRFKQCGLDERLSLADFDWHFNPKVPRQACFELHALKFITEGINGPLIGKPGTGKSHIAKGDTRLSAPIEY